MEAEQEIQEDVQYQAEETYMDEDETTVPQEQVIEPEEEYPVTEEAAEEAKEQREEPEEKDILQSLKSYDQEEDRGSFVHGLSVGLGIGCIATFIIMWIVVFFSPQLPSTVTYEGMLSIFIYPLIYLLAVGLIALTAGLVKEYYVKKSSL
jgi:hypothetical protein